MRKQYIHPSTDLIVLQDVCTFTSYSVIKGNSDGTSATSTHEQIDIGNVYDDGTTPKGDKESSYYDDAGNWGGD